MKEKKDIKKQNEVHISYWEKRDFLDGKDVIIIGSGLVGLFTAYFLKKKNVSMKILVLERGILPHGASTKNAGFACFGSPSELAEDLKKNGEDRVMELLEMRWKGLRRLRKILGDRVIGYDACGGYDLFSSREEWEEMMMFIESWNKKVRNVTGLKNTYCDATREMKEFGFRGFSGMIKNVAEGSVQTGHMMQALLQLCRKSGIEVLNGCRVMRVEDSGKNVIVDTNYYSFMTRGVIICTNGFASELTGRKDVVPARAQVLITRPVKNIRFRGTFHFQSGFYYFRPLDGRVLLGGGRNLDIKKETTTDFSLTAKIQQALENLLKENILPGYKVETEHRWAGIMGVGPEKRPLIEFISPRVMIAVRMGGMGVAIASMVGEKAAEGWLKRYS